MKIAMIGHKRIPSREGGVERVVEELAVRMAEVGHTVHAYNRKGSHINGKKFDNNLYQHLKSYRCVRIITIPTFQNGNLNAPVYSFLAIIKSLFGRYDVIHFHAEGACALLWLPHILGIKTVVTIHGLDWKREKWGGAATEYLKFCEKIAARYADEVIVLSKNVQTYFLKTYGRKVQFIPNGVEKPVLSGNEIIKKKLKLEKNGYLLFLARIVPEKGLHYLIKAYKNVHTNKKLVIAGGSSHSNHYLDEIKKLISQDDRIIMTGFVQGDLLEELYSNAYIYILPSNVEGMPISLLEAMSFGNCCLVSDIHENLEVIEDKAIKFKKGNIKNLTEKIQWLSDSPMIVDKYKKSASDYICNKYNWEKVVKNTIEIYENAVSATEHNL